MYRNIEIKVYNSLGSERWDQRA